MSQKQAKAIIDEAFEDAALTLGGIFVVYRVENAVINEAVSALDMARTKILAGLNGQNLDEVLRDEERSIPPAIEKFIDKIRGGR